MAVRGWVRRVALPVFLATIIVGCGSGETPIGPSTNPLLEPFVGTWDATVLTAQSLADTTLVADILGDGGASYIVISESGNYQSTLVYAESGIGALTEFGTLEVQEDFLTLRRNNGDPINRAYLFVSPTTVRLDGPSDFDFNRDEIADPAYLFMEMVKR